MELKKLFKTDSRTLRNYGLTMAVPLLIIAAVLFWKDRPAAPYFLVLSGLFGLLGLAVPRILKPVYIAWMTFAYYLSYVMTYVILTLFFYIIMTPTALVIRLLGKDLLSRKFPDTRESCWKAAQTYDDDIERYSKPY